MRKKHNWLKKNYSECWNFIKDSKKFIYSIIFIFLFFALIGFFVPVPSNVYDALMQLIEELLAQTEGLSTFGLIKFIFLNNLQSSFLGLIFGLIFGIFPFFSALMNGYLLGFVANMSVSSAGVLSLWQLLPHGIFELPAVFISLGFGLRLGFGIFNKTERKNFKENFSLSLKTFFFVVFPLLVIAAFIEGFLIFFLK